MFVNCWWKASKNCKKQTVRRCIERWFNDSGQPTRSGSRIKAEFYLHRWFGGCVKISGAKSGYCRWHLQAGERKSCGCSAEDIIKSTKSKAPKDFQAFLQNGENRNKLVDLLCETISNSPDRALVILQTSVICFSKEDSCVRVNASQVTTGSIVLKSRKGG